MRKRIRKVHLRTDKTDSGLACNSAVFTPLMTSDLDQVTCNCCIFTDIFKDIASEKEKERDAGGEELGYEVLDYKVLTKARPSWLYLTSCGYLPLATVGNRECELCDYHISHDSKKQQVKCSFKAKNKPKEVKVKNHFGTLIVVDMNREQFNTLFDYLKKHNIISFNHSKEKTSMDILQTFGKDIQHVDKFIKNGFKEEKTQKSLNESIEKEDLFTKYNLNSTHKAFIKEHGEVEAFKQDNRNCFGCCFHYLSMNQGTDYIDCSGVKCLENKVKFRLKKEEIMSDEEIKETTEISISDKTPTHKIDHKFSELSVGDYFLWDGVLNRKVMSAENNIPLIELVCSGDVYYPETSIYKSIKANTVEMVEKVTIQYIRKEQ